MDRSHRQPIDKLSAADSVLALLQGLATEKLPHDERIAIANAQIEAAEDWFSAFMAREAIGASMPSVKGRTMGSAVRHT